MKYGMPYKGSKNKLAGQIFELFMDAVHGKFKDEKRWISREDFFRLKDSEPYVKFCWSFGNNLRNYLYSKEIEEFKKAWHYAIFFDDFEPFKKFDVDMSAIKGIKNLYKKYLTSKDILHKCHFDKGKQLQSCEGLFRLQSSESLERLERLERLRITVGSYDQVEILPDSVIYCDIPYEGTDGYLTDFDFEKFYSWCEKQTEPLFISSYKMPSDRFVCVAMFKHRCILNASQNIEVTEKVFIPKHQEKEYHLPGSLFNFDEMM